jgi:hypothetical protein
MSPHALLQHARAPHTDTFSAAVRVRVWGLGFGVWGLRLKLWGVGYRCRVSVSDFGFQVSVVSIFGVEV